MDIRGQVVLVTGTNRGLGKTFVQALVAAGATKVYAASREGGGPVTEKIEPVKLDITDPAAVKAAAEKCPDVTLLVNNAGYLKYGPLLGVDAVSSLREHLEINTVGTLLMTQAFAPVLARNGGGALVNILSVLSWLNIHESGPYSASKAAQWSLTNGLRYELRGQGTLVIGVHPGYIDTDMTAGIDAPKSTPEEVVEMTLQAIKDEITEITIDDVGRSLKRSLSSTDAAYLTFGM